MTRPTDRTKKRHRKHAGTIADGCSVGMPNMVLKVEQDPPFLLIDAPEYTRKGPHIASVTNRRTLRVLAHAILRALGDE